MPSALRTTRKMCLRVEGARNLPASRSVLTSPCCVDCARCACSLDEWLEFSSMLGSLSVVEFDNVIGRYIEGVRKELAGK